MGVFPFGLPALMPSTTMTFLIFLRDFPYFCKTCLNLTREMQCGTRPIFGFPQLFQR